MRKYTSVAMEREDIEVFQLSWGHSLFLNKVLQQRSRQNGTV